MGNVRLVAAPLLLALAHAGCPFITFHESDRKVPDHSVAPSPECPAEELKRLKMSVDPDPGQMTIKGCKCTSSCGATVDFGAANCDWCYTADKCGSYAYSRFAYYDYCVYPKNATYEAHDWQWKQDYLWSRVTASRKHASYPNVANIIGESIQTSFDDQWDWMPAGRLKYIHSVGAVCKFSWNVSPDSPYTGVFSPGAREGIVRMGPAASVSPSGGLIPGIGIKFLRSGKQSANWVALNNLGPIEGFNFFSENLTNHLPPPPLSALPAVLKFQQASTCVTAVGLSDAAKYDHNGFAVDDPIFPYELVFVPTGQISTNGTSTDAQMAGLQDIPVGTVLWTVYAYENPIDRNDPSIEPTRLAVMSTISECRTSDYGDNHLFFRHQRMEEDFQLREEWIPHVEPGQECGASEVTPNPPEKCTDL